jgi:hypothetical protein
MPFDAPFALGPFIVEPNGRLSPDLGAVPAFRIEWRARIVEIRMRVVGDGSGVLTAAMTLGRAPSSAAFTGLAERERAFATIRRLPAAVPPGWTVALIADHRIILEAELALDLPASAISLVTELTQFLIAVDPYLTLLEEAGLGFALPGSGASSTA